MSTRAVAEVFNDDGTILVTIYKHWDGYPDGFGADLEKICSKYKLVNGLGMGDNTFVSNGMGCFAATLIKTLKDDAGDVYITLTGSRGWAEYLYKIKPNGDRIEVICEEL